MDEVINLPKNVYFYYQNHKDMKNSDLELIEEIKAI